MTILEILEAHYDAAWNYKGRRECACGYEFTERYSAPLHRAHAAQVLEEHMQEREAEAVRETARYIERLYPRKGLINRADLLADIEIAADRLGRGLHANGRDKDTSNGR